MATTKTTKSAIAAAFKPTLTLKQIDAEITSVVDASKTLQSRIQELAVAIMLHTYNHGDYSRAQTLVDSLGEGVRRSALVAWFHKAGLDVDEQKGFVGFNKPVMEKNWADVKASPWYSMKPERPFEGFDMKAELERLIKKAEKAMKTAAETPEMDAALMKVTPEQIKALRELAGVQLQ